MSAPALDIALTHALLTDVAAERRAPALRVFRPRPTAAFGRLDALRPGFERACAAALDHGYVPVLRLAGGHAALFDERCVVVDHVTRERDATAGLQARFEDQSARVRDALRSLGADARIGELAGEYCPGEYSVNAGGHAKVAGVAQRIVRHGAVTTAVVVAGGGARLRAAIADVYGALELPVDVDTAAALDEHVAGVTVEQVERALHDSYGTDGTLEPDAELLAAARALLPRHSLPTRGPDRV